MESIECRKNALPTDTQTPTNINKKTFFLVQSWTKKTLYDKFGARPRADGQQPLTPLHYYNQLNWYLIIPGIDQFVIIWYRTLYAFFNFIPWMDKYMIRAPRMNTHTVSMTKLYLKETWEKLLLRRNEEKGKYFLQLFNSFFILVWRYLMESQFHLDPGDQASSTVT